MFSQQAGRRNCSDLVAGLIDELLDADEIFSRQVENTVFAG